MIVLALAAVLMFGAPTDSYLAYRVRIARGETSYRLDTGLTILAATRAREAGTTWAHRQVSEVPCAWGEILGWSAQSGKNAVRWALIAWRRSPTHWRVLRAPWRYYGVATYRRADRTYMAVVFAQCRI